MAQFPSPAVPDATVPFRLDPYGWIPETARSLGTDAFESRLLLKKTVFLTGPDAVEVFYDRAKFTRTDAAPARLQHTLFGSGGVQGLDGEAHAKRKAMFVSLLSAGGVAEIGRRAAAGWDAEAAGWPVGERVSFYDASRRLLTRVACGWAGVPLPEEDVAERTRELSLMYESAGAVGPTYLWGWRGRVLGERWVAGLIEGVRSGELGEDAVPADAPLRVVAGFHDAGGAPLSEETAAVEVLNLLRPIVAVSVWQAFAALALHEHREAAGDLSDPARLDAFAEEVRRFYPFFPAVLAIVREGFTWKGFEFPEGRPVVLDLHGTNHDPRLWDRPDAFDPSRFLGERPGHLGPIPQGGGSVAGGHRCPGEDVARELIRQAALFLTDPARVRFEVPADQDLSVAVRRLPALPRSGFELIKTA